MIGISNASKVPIAYVATDPIIACISSSFRGRLRDEKCRVHQDATVLIFFCGAETHNRIETKHPK